jgi:4-alpha-glucanotransferase
VLTRSSGVLLHPTSLPGRFGIGDLGPAADEWITWLASTGCRYWQVLPLGPTGYGDSPYQSFSTFAGNPYLVSPELLVDDGLLTPAELEDAPVSPPGRVDFGRVIPWKLGLLDTAYARLPGAGTELRAEFDAFREEHSRWLDDYTLFMALKVRRGGGSWADWPDKLKRRRRRAMRAARKDTAGDVERLAFRQFLFYRQWGRVAALAADAGLRIIGDVPFYVAPDSADVWANPELFLLDGAGDPAVVAGVPPDYFSETGQLWGNPIYDWEAMAGDGYGWWIDRLATLRTLVDLIRIDHFRAFADYWEVPAGSKTAEVGRWVDGPGEPFFAAVETALGELPIIAEDLGELHDVVPELRDRLGLPGMKVLQFAFDGDPGNPFLPEHYPESCVVYTGTHDNETAAGWYAGLEEQVREDVLAILGSDGADVAADMITAAWRSRAVLAVTPVQDVLGLDNDSRMNTPGTLGGNWDWRMTTLPDATAAARLAALNTATRRHRDRRA